MWISLIIAFVVAAAYADIKWRRIPRMLAVAGFLAGLLYNGLHGKLLTSLLASAVGFVIGLLLFRLGAIGGGDVKLITALGAMLGFDSWLLAMEVAVFAAALMAVVQVLRKRAVRQTIRNMGEILRSFFTSGLNAHPVLNVSNPQTIRSPFAVAAAIGTIVALIR